MAVLLGVISSLFFASTFVLNRAMELDGGYWAWSAVLRYLFMLPPLLVLVWFRGNLKQLFTEMLEKPVTWLVWSTVGFGIFYAPICFAAAYGPSWLVASTWQITIYTTWCSDNSVSTSTERFYYECSNGGATCGSGSFCLSTR